ncbi:hypothetical protein [Persicitalea sp.]|uniref:hypothetical protein n=1 Tax=Persicitalea sp. TaxID=3100273 RepID=UPI003593FDBF
MKTLIFVYNADTGLGDGAVHFFHKLLLPQSYPCGLCAITFDTFSLKQSWKKFLFSLPQECRFLHRDEFLLHYDLASTCGFPAVFGVDNNELTQVLTSEEIDSAQTCEQLISLISPLINARTT